MINININITPNVEENEFELTDNFEVKCFFDAIMNDDIEFVIYNEYNGKYYIYTRNHGVIKYFGYGHFVFRGNEFVLNNLPIRGARKIKNLLESYRVN